VWSVVAVGVALFGLLPRATRAAWFVATGAVLVGLFGPLLDLPQAVTDLSPFAHAPKLPGSPVDATGLVVLSLLCVAALALGVVGARRRDVGA
jgi:ABC-2 type transport system permease protein